MFACSEVGKGPMLIIFFFLYFVNVTSQCLADVQGGCVDVSGSCFAREMERYHDRYQAAKSIFC